MRKMLKRSLSLVLALSMVVLLLGGITIASAETKETTYSASLTESVVDAGNGIYKLTLNVKGPARVRTTFLSMAYDSSVITPVSATKYTALSAPTNAMLSTEFDTNKAPITVAELSNGMVSFYAGIANTEDMDFSSGADAFSIYYKVEDTTKLNKNSIKILTKSEDLGVTWGTHGGAGIYIGESTSKEASISTYAPDINCAHNGPDITLDAFSFTNSDKYALGGVTVNDVAAIAVPKAGAEDSKTALTAAYTDDGGEVINSFTGTTEWALVDATGKAAAYDGISIVDGKLVVTPAAAGAAQMSENAMTVYVKADATYNSVTKTSEVKAIKLTREDSVTTSIKFFKGDKAITADTVTVPGNGYNSAKYTVEAYDQYGIVDSGANIAITHDNYYGTNINTDTAKTIHMLIGEDASAGSFTITAAASGVTETITVNVVKLALPAEWTAISTKTNPTYGDTNADIIVGEGGGTLDCKLGEATVTLKGTYTVNDADTKQDAGEKTITVTFTASGSFLANGDYANKSFTKDYTVTIAKKDASALTVGDIAAVTYNGAEQKPVLTVKDGETALVLDTDYTVAYSNNKNAGEATATITGTGNYAGTKTANFTINKATLTIGAITAVTYNATEQKPVLVVNDGATVLTDADYTVAYSNNINAGTATATITGKGNYTGTKTANFTINKADRTVNVTNGTLYLTIGKLSDTIIAAASADLDKSAVLTYSVETGAQYAKVNKDGLVTALGNGDATVKVNIAATANYNAATAATVTVHAMTNPIDSITVSVGAKDDLYAEVSGTNITITGMKQDTTVVRLTINGVEKTITDGKITVDVFDGDNKVSVPYTVDMSKIVIVPANIEIKDVAPVSDTAAITDTKIKAALNDALALTTTKGLGTAAAAAMVSESQRLVIDKATKIEGMWASAEDYTVVVETKLNITATAATENKKVVLEITPAYTVIAVDNNDKSIKLELQGETTLDNGKLSGLTTISVDMNSFLAAGVFGHKNNLYINHGNDTLKPTWNSKTMSFQTASYSEFTIVEDNRSATITYNFSDGSTQTIVYDPSNIGTALPTDSISNFAGWNITKKGETTAKVSYATKLTADLLVANGAVYTADYATSSGGGGSSVSSYIITATAGEGGTIAPSGKISVTQGASKTYTITANAGYKIADVLVDGKSVGAVSTYTFNKVSAKHTISATFAKTAGDVSAIFTDVAATSWYHDAVQFVYDKSMMNGTGNGKFSPNANLSRAMLVTILYRVEGSPAVTGTSAFTDVAGGTWYTDAVIWASNNKIVNGVGGGKFEPNTNITREQLAAILYRYASAKGYDVTASGNLAAFSDGANVSSYAAASVKWAVGADIINGSNGKLNAKGTATRAEAATMLMRFVNQFVK